MNNNADGYGAASWLITQSILNLSDLPMCPTKAYVLYIIWLIILIYQSSKQCHTGTGIRKICPLPQGARKFDQCHLWRKN